MTIKTTVSGENAWRIERLGYAVDASKASATEWILCPAWSPLETWICRGDVHGALESAKAMIAEHIQDVESVLRGKASAYHRFARALSPTPIEKALHHYGETR